MWVGESEFQSGLKINPDYEPDPAKDDHCTTLYALATKLLSAADNNIIMGMKYATLSAILNLKSEITVTFTSKPQ